MLKSSPKGFLKRQFLNDYPRYFSAINDDTNIDKLRDQLKDGPELSDFIGGVVKRDQKWSDYSGKLKRDKGESERLAIS